MSNVKRKSGSQWHKQYPELNIQNLRGWEIYTDNPMTTDIVFKKKNITERQFQINLCYCSVTDMNTKFSW